MLAGPGALTGVDAVLDERFTPVSDAVSAVIFYEVPVGGADLPLIVLWLIAAQLGQSPRFLHEKGTSKSCWHRRHRSWTKPREKSPQRRYPRSSSSTYRGSTRERGRS